MKKVIENKKEEKKVIENKKEEKGEPLEGGNKISKIESRKPSIQILERTSPRNRP